MLPSRGVTCFVEFCFEMYELQHMFPRQNMAVTFPLRHLPLPIPSFLHDIICPKYHLFHIVRLTPDMKQAFRMEMASATYYAKRARSDSAPTQVFTPHERRQLADFINLAFTLSNLVIDRLEGESTSSDDPALNSLEDVSSSISQEIQDCICGG